MKRGDLIKPRSSPSIPLDLITHDERWIPFNQGEIGIILETFPHSHSLTWVTVLTPSGVGDCYASDLEVLNETG